LRSKIDLVGSLIRPGKSSEKKAKTSTVPVSMSENNFVVYPSSNHYCRVCEFPHNKKGCGVFSQTSYLLPPNHLAELSEQQEDNLNMLSFTEEDSSPHLYQFSSNKVGNQPRVFPLSSRQLDACKSTMFPTSMAVPGGKMAAYKVSKVQSKAATMMAKITKTCARKNKVPNDIDFLAHY
jgi:hypothetical protein